MKTVCVWPVLVAPVLWLMAKAAISKEEYEKIKAERARKKEVNLKQIYFLIVNKD